MVMVSSSFLLSSSSVVGGGPRVRVGRVEGVLLVSLVDVDRVFGPVDSGISVSSFRGGPLAPLS